MGSMGDELAALWRQRECRKGKMADFKEIIDAQMNGTILKSDNEQICSVVEAFA